MIKHKATQKPLTLEDVSKSLTVRMHVAQRGKGVTDYVTRTISSYDELEGLLRRVRAEVEKRYASKIIIQVHMQGSPKIEEGLISHLKKAGLFAHNSEFGTLLSRRLDDPNNCYRGDYSHVSIEGVSVLYRLNMTCEFCDYIIEGDPDLWVSNLKKWSVQ